MQHCFVIPDLLLPSRQYAAKAIHPDMRFFHNSAMSPELAVFNYLRLRFPRLDMRVIATGFQTNFQPFSLIAFTYTGATCDSACRSVAHPAYLLPALMSRAFSPATTTGNGSPFTSVIRLRFTACFPLSVGLRAVFLSLQGAILSCNHPSITMTSQWHPASRRPAVRFVRSVQILQHPAIPESGCELNWMRKYPWHSGHSTGNPF